MQADFPQLDVRQTGDVSLDDAINDRVADDLSSAETLSLPVTLILMLLAFGALIAAGIPVLLAGTSVAATVGILAPVSHLIHADSTVTSMIVLIGMAVGVDYSLFYLKREREERAKGHSHPRRRRDRRPDLRALDPGLRGAVICVDGRPVRDRRHDVQLARRRLDHRGGGRRARLDHRAAGAARRSSAAGWTARGSRCCTGHPADRTRRHQRPGARPGRAAPARRAGPVRRGRRAARHPGPRHEDAQRQPRDAAQLDPRGADRAGPQPRVPVGGHHRRPGRQGRRRPAGRGRRGAAREVEAAADDFALFRPSGTGRGLEGRHHLGARPWRCRSTSPTTGSTPRSRSSAPSWPRPRWTTCTVEYAVGGDAAESLDFVRPRAVPAAAGDRLRAAADPADHGRRPSAACRSR